MVDWYEPGQLVKTVMDVEFSTTLGRHADNRRAQALTPGPKFLDYSSTEYLDPAGCFWFDYVADCGDGGNSTYAVASTLASDECLGLERGRLLVLGGDGVYPTASPMEYDRRLVAPYQAALPSPPEPPPEVLAIPGNHDWYDSLSSFLRLFCSGERFAGWRTKQSRSYFAAKLPRSWWLLGVDVQLCHDIDQLQLRAFQELAKDFTSKDRVILCCPEPFWIAEQQDRDRSARLTKTNLQKLVADLGDRVRVTLAGDLHHYRRHSDGAGRHRITCGCGGAFTHPTHDRVPSTLHDGFVCEKSFPPRSVSRWLTWLNFGFLFKNPWFGILTGVLYLLIAWGLGANMGERFEGGVQIEEIAKLPISEPLKIAKAAIHTAILSEVSMGFILAMFLAFVLFSDRHYKRFKWVAGILHGALHLIGATFVYWLATRLCISEWGLQAKTIQQYLLAGAIILPGGWIVGSLIMGGYLWASLNLFGQHSNEAFSSLRIQDWKGFLRMRVSPEGNLDLHFIGMRKVPRKWLRNELGGPLWLPGDGRGICELIDRVTVS
jgi:hypothetical protein